MHHLQEVAVERREDSSSIYLEKDSVCQKVAEMLRLQSGHMILTRLLFDLFFSSLFIFYFLFSQVNSILSVIQLWD